MEILPCRHYLTIRWICNRPVFPRGTYGKYVSTKNGENAAVGFFQQTQEGHRVVISPGERKEEGLNTKKLNDHLIEADVKHREVPLSSGKCFDGEKKSHLDESIIGIDLLPGLGERGRIPDSTAEWVPAELEAESGRQ